MNESRYFAWSKQLYQLLRVTLVLEIVKTKSLDMAITIKTHFLNMLWFTSIGLGLAYRTPHTKEPLPMNQPATE